MTEQELQQIEAAKAALVIWLRFEGSDMSNLSDAEIKTCFEQREIIRNAAPALVRRVQELEDWQAKALPLVKKVYTSLTPLKNGGYVLDGSKFIQYELGEIKKLERLIEQAEGGK